MDSSMIGKIEKARRYATEARGRIVRVGNEDLAKHALGVLADQIEDPGQPGIILGMQVEAENTGH